jgi:hypothetical protein
MAERTLKELSEASKKHFEAQEWQEATNCLVEARDRFPQTALEGETERRIVQDSDGSLKIRILKPNLRTEGFFEERVSVE